MKAPDNPPAHARDIPPSIKLGEDLLAARDALPSGHSMWVENGKLFAAPTVDRSAFGPHDYFKDGYQPGKRDCRCGCWMGDCRSSGPVDPFGPCPLNPAAPTQPGK